MIKQINSVRAVVAATLTVFLFLLTLAFFPAPVLAQETEGGQQQQGEPRPPNPEGDLVRQLNLSPDQIEKIRAIRQQNQELRRAIGQRVRAARGALDRAIYVENADEAVVEQRARELAEAQAANVRLQAMTELSIRRILTPEQLETFRALRLRAESERRARRRRGDAIQPGNGNLPPLRERLRRRRNMQNPTDGNNGQGLSPTERRSRP